MHRKRVHRKIEQIGLKAPIHLSDFATFHPIPRHLAEELGEKCRNQVRSGTHGSQVLQEGSITIAGRECF